eukprot:COSAG05_NODE_805_length_7205_cov_12.164650_2_plen_217_part_00
MCVSCVFVRARVRVCTSAPLQLFASSDPTDQQLWSDWYAWTRAIAVQSCFSDNAEQKTMARDFVVETLKHEGHAAGEEEVFSSAAACTAALEALTPSPDHMLWFEYNFLFVLCADGEADPAKMGSHTAKVRACGQSLSGSWREFSGDSDRVRARGGFCAGCVAVRLCVRACVRRRATRNALVFMPSQTRGACSTPSGSRSTSASLHARADLARLRR